MHGRRATALAVAALVALAVPGCTQTTDDAGDSGDPPSTAAASAGGDAASGPTITGSLVEPVGDAPFEPDDGRIAVFVGDTGVDELSEVVVRVARGDLRCADDAADVMAAPPGSDVEVIWDGETTYESAPPQIDGESVVVECG